MIQIAVTALVTGLWWLVATLIPKFKNTRTRAMQFTAASFVLFIAAAAMSTPRQAVVDDGSQARASFAVECKRLLRQQLKAPDSAKIPNYYDGDGLSESKKFVVWQDSFQSQNSFGVMLRSNFRCQSDKKTGLITVQIFKK